MLSYSFTSVLVCTQVTRSSEVDKVDGCLFGTKLFADFKGQPDPMVSQITMIQQQSQQNGLQLSKKY